MKRCLILFLSIFCLLFLFGCSAASKEGQVWDCTVECVEESGEDAYVISYSDQEVVVPRSGTLTFQNRNEFDIVVHLLTGGEEEEVLDVPAGGVFVRYQLEQGTVYTVGCHADVEIGTEIALMVYEGERAEPWS